MNHSINDGHLGTNRATPKDIYPTWTPSAIKSDFEPSRHHRSASGYPSGPDYVSSSRRHAENPPSGRDYKPRNVSESQPPPIPPQMRYRESHYADAVHPRPSHRKDPTVDSAAYASASKRHAHDPSVVRNNNSAEDVIQYPRVPKYERWIPPNQPPPPSQPQEPQRERDREKDRQKTREDHHRERHDEVDAREKHKRRYNEGDSDWDKDRERKERREKERYREWERERAKEQERERAKEDLERVRAKERTKEKDRHRDEREQERYAEKERRRAAEKEKEKGREKEREREREREKEKEKERERRRQKEKESGQDRRRDRKDVEKQENTRPKADLDREKRKEREPAPLERDYRHEVERGRDSDRELLDRRKRKLDWESEKEKEKVKETSKRTGDVLAVIHESRRQEVEHGVARKAHEAFRKDPVERPMPLVVREQDMDRPRPSKKDTDSPRQRELQKVNEQLEAEHAHYTDKENLPRREHKSYEKSKRSAGNRPHADRATDSERENPPQRDVGLSNPHLRETVLRGTVEADPIATSRLPPLPAKQARDERASYAFPMGPSTTTRVTAPAFFEIPRMAAANDGYGGHTLPTSRPVDQTLSAMPKYSPISVASAESQKMDMGTSENKVKSSQRALRRQSKMSSLVPDQIAVLSLSHAAKHNPSHVISSTRGDQPLSSHAFRIEKEDVTHLHLTQVPVDSSLHNPMPPATLAKTDNRTNTPMHKLPSSSLNNTGSRSLARNSTIMPLASLYDRPIVESSQAIPSVPRDLQGGSSVPGIQTVTQRSVNDGDTKHASGFLYKTQVHTYDNPAHLSASGYVAPLPVSRNPLDKIGRHISLPSDRPISVAFNSVPAFGSAPNGILKTSSKGVVKAPNISPLAVFEPEMKVITERSQVVPPPGLLAVPLEMQQGPKRGGEPLVDRVQNASEVPVRRPPSVYGSSKDPVFLESLQEQRREKALVADSVHNTSEVPLRRPPSAVGRSTPQGSMKDVIHLEMQPEQKRERGPVTDNVQNVPEAPLQRPPSVAGWSTLQTGIREAVHLETRQESKREKVLMADRVQNTSNSTETSTRMLTSAAGGSTLPGGIKEVAHLDPQQEPKREKLPVANRVQNPSEAPLAAVWPPLQGGAKEHLNPQQELKREKVLVADETQNAPEVPMRVPSSVVMQGNNVREVAQLETQREPKREKAPAANRVQNAPEVASRRLPSAAGWPTSQGNFKESASLEMQQEPKREKASMANKVQNAPEVPLRSVTGLPTLQGSVREVAHLETQQEPKREKAPAADRVQHVAEAPLRIPSFTPGRPTLHGSAKELDSQQEPKREKAVVDGVQNAPEVQLRIIPSATGPTLQGNVREAGSLETQQEPKRERLLVADRVQNADVPLRRPPSAAGWPTLQGSIKELASLESQREPKRERLPVVEAAPCETQQEPKRGRELVVDRAQNSSEIPSRIPPPVAGSSSLQGSIREVTPLETQPEPKRERVSISDRAQNALEVPARRPPSVVGWSTSQGSARDKATSSNANASELPAYPIEQPISMDGHLTGLNSAQMTSSTRTTGFYVSKQEGLLSRVQVKTPIPEDVSTSTPNGLPPTFQPETSSQTNTAVPDRHCPPEHSAIPLTNLRSIGEPIITLTPVTKTLSKTPGDGFVWNKQVAGDSHPTSSASQENVPFLLPDQHGDRDGFNSRSRGDQANTESFQTNSPATSLRRDAFVQPSLSKSSNVIEVPRNVSSRPPASNHSRNRSSTQKAAEELIIAASHSSSSKPSEETNVRAAPIPLGRHVEQPGVGMSSSKDPIAPARAKGDRTSSVGQYTEQELMIPFRGPLVDDGIIIAPTNHAISVISRDGGHKSTRHSRQTDHRHSPQTSLHKTIDNATYAGDTLQRQFREVGTDKKPPPQVNNHLDTPGSREEKVYNHHNESQAPEDKKPTIQHEGLARILDQPLDRHVKKIRASPSTQSSHSGLPQEEFQMPSNEVDRRRPVSGSPKTMLRSSSSMSHNAPSPIVKTLSHMNYGTNYKSNIIQENLVQDAYNRPNISASGYPHHVYRSSSLYPATISSAPHISSESSKNQMHPSHTLSIHNHANSYQSSSIEAGQTRNSPSHQTTPLISHPPMPVKRPLADATENGDPASSRYPGTHAKMSTSGSRADVTLSHQSRPSDLPSNSRTLDIANGRAVFNEAVHLDTSSRAQESSPGVAPAASLLLSKPTDPHGPSEHKGNIDMTISTSNHPTRGTGNMYDSSPRSHELENHEPRLITPRIQQHPELTEEPRKKGHSLDVAKAKPLDEVHKKSASVDVVKSKSEQRPHEIWYPPNRDDQGEGKTRPPPISIAGPVANKGVPAALPADNGQSRPSTRPEHIRHGRKSPNIANMKVYRYLREKRNRTISAVSMEAQDGTAPNTVVGSPTASVISQAPPIHIPSPRDPMKAAQEWLTEGIQAAMLAEAQGRRRILRPGVVFDVGEDPPRDEQRHRSKRPARAQSRRA